MTNVSTGHVIPDGLWYCDLSHGAVRVLGWLHVQDSTDSIRAEDVRAVFGPSANSWLAELVMAGFLDPNRTSGKRLRYTFVESAWQALG